LLTAAFICHCALCGQWYHPWKPRTDAAAGWL